jgi:hypothetical protein
MSETLTLPNQKTAITWTSYLAVGIAEGFEEIPIDKLSECNSNDASVEAWAIIIKYKLWKGLQGWFGRNAEAILNSKIVSEDGTINWDELENNNDLTVTI